MKIVFVGNGDFARDLLEQLLKAGVKPLAVITNRDAPAGRGRHLRPVPVAAFATATDVKMYKTEGPWAPEFAEILRKHDPEVILVADYGHRIPSNLLALFPGRILNLHPSLLPLYRGAAPITRALMDGVEVTGVSIMVLDEGLDTGPVIDSAETAVGLLDDAGTLRRKLAELGALLVARSVPLYLSGQLSAKPQEHGMATYAPPIRKEELFIDWNLPSLAIHNQVRALAPSPGARARLGGKWMRILKTHPRQGRTKLLPGEIDVAGVKLMVVGTGEGALEVLVLQPEGKRPMNSDEFLRGWRPGGAMRFEAVV